MKEKIGQVKKCELISCGKEFIIYGQSKRQIKKRFCSLKCSSVNNGLLNKGRKHTEEQKRLMSESRKGEKNHFFGKKHTDETKKKISENNGSKKRDFSINAISIEDKIKQNIRIDEMGCWIWTGWRRIKAKTGDYGGIKINGKSMLAHRASYATFNGLIPEGMEVCHKCDVTICVNPSHLFLGTHHDNMRDMAIKKRGTNGEKSVNSKFTVTQVFEIRELIKTKTYKEVAAKYKVSIPTILAIVTRKSWSHI